MLCGCAFGQTRPTPQIPSSVEASELGAGELGVPPAQLPVDLTRTLPTSARVLIPSDPDATPIPGTRPAAPPLDSDLFASPPDTAPPPAIAESQAAATATPVPAAVRRAKPDFGRTMIGTGPEPQFKVPEPPPDTQQSAAPVAAAPQKGFHSTMLGLAPTAAVASAPSGTPVTQVLAKKTFLGLAPEAPHLPEPEPAQVQLSTKPAGLSGTLVMPREAPLEPARTLLGVARPGIAPLNPGVSKPAAPPETFPSPPPPPAPYVAADSLQVPSPPPTSPTRSRWLAALALGGAAAILAIGGAFFFLTRGPGPIEAKATQDGDGKELLELLCKSCVDGQLAKIGDKSATFKDQRAKIEVSGGLKVGNNPFELTLEKSGSAQQHVQLNVPLDYRVESSLDGLQRTPPVLLVRFTALPNTQVSAAGVPVKLDAGGKGEFALDVSPELSGLEARVKRLERKISYVITPPGGSATNAEVSFQLSVVPLSLEAPGQSITIETPTFLLAGATSKGSEVSISGRKLQVDADGRFNQEMAVSSLGETTVTLRASAPNLAPRLYGFRVRRVASLAAEAKTFRADATSSYSAMAIAAQQHSPQKVALSGSVVDVGKGGQSTLFLLDAKGGCGAPPCLTRVLHGARLQLRTGQNVSVFGKLLGDVDGPRSGTRIPEVFADFVVMGTR